MIMRFEITMFVGLIALVAITIWVIIPLIGTEFSPQLETFLYLLWCISAATTLIGAGQIAMNRDIKRK